MGGAEWNTRLSVKALHNAVVPTVSLSIMGNLRGLLSSMLPQHRADITDDEGCEPPPLGFLSLFVQ